MIITEYMENGSLDTFLKVRREEGSHRGVLVVVWGSRRDRGGEVWGGGLAIRSAGGTMFLLVVLVLVYFSGSQLESQDPHHFLPNH